MQYSSVIEYDIIFFQQIRLLLNYSNLNCVLAINLTPYFPDERFSMVLQSVNHVTSGGKPMQIHLREFPYNTHWEVKRMIGEAFIFLINFVISEFCSSKY